VVARAEAEKMLLCNNDDDDDDDAVGYVMNYDQGTDPNPQQPHPQSDGDNCGDVRGVCKEEGEEDEVEEEDEVDKNTPQVVTHRDYRVDDSGDGAFASHPSVQVCVRTAATVHHEGKEISCLLMRYETSEADTGTGTGTKVGVGDGKQRGGSRDKERGRGGRSPAVGTAQVSLYAGTVEGTVMKYRLTLSSDSTSSSTADGAGKGVGVEPAETAEVFTTAAAAAAADDGLLAYGKKNAHTMVTAAAQRERLTLNQLAGFPSKQASS
jgi:hypothetical protein